MTSSIITFTTDFGEGSPYVAQMKGAALAVNPRATLVDMTHSIAPQNIRQGALVLLDTSWCFPPKTIHVAVVDPGVGTNRRVVYAEFGDQQYIAPDNGLLSLLARRSAPSRLIELTERTFWRDEISSTFHGRDIMAPAAAHLSLGLAPDALGRPAAGLVELALPAPIVAENRITGEVIAVDSFGNLITNITSELLTQHLSGKTPDICVGQHRVCGISAAYAEHAAGELLALVGSSGRLEIAVANGNAARVLNAGEGAPIEVDWD